MASKVKYNVGYEKDFQDVLKHYTNQGYQIVRKHLYDPVNSIFSSDRKRKSWVEINFCSHKETCPAYKNGECLCYNLGLEIKCPYTKTYYKEGVTRRSRAYNDFIYAAKTVFNINYNKIEQRINGLYHTSLIGDNKIVYINLPHLENYVNSITTELNMSNRKLIPIEYFTPTTINKLLNFHPFSLMGGEILTYQKEEIPKFVRDLKVYFPELYKQTIIGTSFENKDKQIDYTGKKAHVKTLLPGKIKIGIEIWNWTGEKIIGQGSFLHNGLNNESIEITPDDTTIVIVVDNDTVTDETILKSI